MPKERIIQSEIMRKRLNKIIEEGISTKSDVSILDGLIKRAIAYIVTKTLEEELTDWLGRDHYDRGDRERKGYRNGYDDAHVKTENGKVKVKKPKVRDTEERYRSKLWATIKNGSEELKEKVIKMYARGLSMRDIEEVFRDKEGMKLLSRTSVSRITEELWDEYEKFKERDLSGLKIEYLFLDAVYEAIRKEVPGCEGTLVAWGITGDGRKVLIHIELGNKESEEAWLNFLRDMIRRGLNIPVLVVSDGAPGLINAIEQIFPKSLRQRCLVHKMRNVLNKVPESRRDELKAKIKAVYYAGDQKLARLLAKEVELEYRNEFPSAMDSFRRDFEACIAYMGCPEAHHRYIRTTNMLERSFLEEKRRTNTIPGFFTEKSALKLVFATLLRVRKGWNRVRMTEVEKKRLMELREKLDILPGIKIDHRKKVA